MTRPDPATLTRLADLRAGIDAIDDEIMGLLAERLAHADAVVPIKAREGVAAAAPTRYGEVIENIRALAVARGFDAEIAEAMWRVMIDAIIARETRVLGTDGEDA